MKKLPTLTIARRTIISVAVAALLSTTSVSAQTDVSVTLDTTAEAINIGDFREAITQWSPVIEKMRANSNANSEVDDSDELVGLSLATLLLRRGEAYLRLGFYNRASNDLQESLALSNELNLTVLQSIVIGSLGDLHTAAQHNRSFRSDKLTPGELYEQSFALAKEAGNPALLSAAGVKLGSWYLDNGKTQLGFGTLEDSVFLAGSTNSALLKADAGVNYARAARLLEFEADASEILRTVLEQIEEIPASYSRAELLLEAGREALEVGDAIANNLGVPAFEKVIEMAGSLADKRVVGAAFSQLGNWYLTSGDEVKAVEMFERGVGVSAGAHDLAIDWEWQLATLYRSRGDIAAAADAYRRSIRHIDSIRSDIPVSYTDGQSSFQETRGPIYLELADLLMQQSDTATTFEAGQALLTEAQLVLEELKRSELQDYFRDTCVVEQSSAVGNDPADSAAVVYPVIFENRMAILLKVDGVIHHYSSDVSADELRQQVSSLAELLRNPQTGGAHLAPAEKVYDWLIAPIAEQLSAADAETLFFVPDGILRTVPLAALWDGSNYLIENYNIASAPGLTLLNAEPLQNTKRRTLAAGISLPGEAIPKLPDSYYSDVYETLPKNQNAAVQRSGANLRSADVDEKIRVWHELTAVAEEIEIPANYNLPSKTLLDEQFSFSTFKDEVLNTPYQIVHVASHGYFGENVEDSWIMTHDDLIDLGELSDLFKPKEFSDNPVELLVLSACSTAEGNDLAPLGLSGVALTSGARSVLGSLWMVEDNATKDLMDNFYRELSISNTSKAGALRNAQISVLKEKPRLHPYFWAAFTLMGNWQ